MSLRSILDYVRYFILFEQDGDGLIKKIAGYHQFHGVREATWKSSAARWPACGSGSAWTAPSTACHGTERFCRRIVGDSGVAACFSLAWEARNSAEMTSCRESDI